MVDTKSSMPLIVLTLVLVVGVAAIGLTWGDDSETNTGPDTEITTFTSEQDFKEYLALAQRNNIRGSLGFGAGIPRTQVDAMATDSEMMEENGNLEADTEQLDETQRTKSTGFEVDRRVSGTNVQVSGIDEPDILKISSDGSTMYYSQEQWGRWIEPRVEREQSIRPRPTGSTKIVNSYPVDELGLESEINTTGELFLAGDTLVVLSHRSIQGYDVSNPDSPSMEWENELNSSLVTARLHNGEIVIVSRDNIDYRNPCPIYPMKEGDNDVVIRCTDIYRPTQPSPVDVTYSIISLDPDTGEVGDTTSFVGTNRDGAVSMFNNSIYVTYIESRGEGEIVLEALLETGDPFLDDWVMNRLRVLDGYDLSDRALMAEIESLMQEYERSLSPEERANLNNNFENEIDDYLEEHKREYESTGIVKVSTDNLEIEDTGSVPGTPLNQFSMDEHNGDLRIATTISQRFGESENDIYVLDEDLEIQGSVQGMGEGMRVYSARFIGDKGYIVTFRQVDPLHVVDLSDPSNPSLEGVLELPGFSSYLHPIDSDTLLGIGEESGEVKAVLFDVSDPTNPEVQDDFILDSRWSEIRETHHAFLMDREHEVFFMPAGGDGYIMSYSDGLSVERIIESENVRRAAYVEDYLYVFSDEEVVVLDQNGDFSRVKRLEF